MCAGVAGIQVAADGKSDQTVVVIAAGLAHIDHLR
jgi:hypothetical protein